MFKQIALATSVYLATSTALFAQAPDTIVVLDVSNSMWGQIDGVSKIEIARGVISDLLADIDTNARFGLMAYGHRRQSDCGDIELVLPLAPLDAAGFSTAVNSLTPRGRTPLTDAVRQAAEVLNYQEQPGRIILVSDGVESCGADPCALATELARGGVDFAAHVVGFDVAGIADQSQLSCLAETTGGLYLTAQSTEELSAALTTVMVAASAPVAVPFAVLLQAPNEVRAGTVFAATWRAKARAGDQILLLPENALSNAALASVDATTGSPAQFTAPDEIGRFALAYLDGKGTELSRAAFTVVERVRLSGPASAVAGAPVEIIWEGPGDERDFLTIVPIDAPVGQYNDYAYVKEGSPVRINTPDRVGEFEIRYVSASSSTILGRQPITLTAPTISLTAVESANAGAPLEVSWTGPNNERDFITIVEVGAREGTYKSYAYTSEGSPARITAIDQPGTFEIRYVSGQSNATLARRLISLEAVAVTLQAVPSAMAGATIEITWKGPNANRDFITIVAPDAREGAYISYAYTTDGATVQLQAPDRPGDFEIRYVSGQSNATLARLPLSLSAPNIMLEVQGPVVAGAPFDVAWSGPDYARDYIGISEAGSQDRAYISYVYTGDGSPLTFIAPEAAGSYELRYFSGQSNAVLARVPLQVGAN